MVDNRIQYGFRWHRGLGGRPMPDPIWCTVASGQSFDVNGGASNVSLGPGDPVRRLSSGHVTLADGAEGSGGAQTVYGIVIGVGPYWDGSKMVRGSVLPDATTYGSVLERQSKVHVVPFEAGVWEIDVDDIVTATTKAAYQALVGENADFRLHGASGDTRAYPRLDISTHATTGSLMCRIVDISPSENNADFAEDYVKLLVKANNAFEPWSSTTGV